MQGGVRYKSGDVLTVSDKTLAAHPKAFEVVQAPAPKKRKPKKAATAPVIEAQDDAPAAEVININGDHPGDNS